MPSPTEQLTEQNTGTKGVDRGWMKVKKKEADFGGCVQNNEFRESNEGAQ